MIDEDSPAAFDHPAHSAVHGADLHNALKHLNCASVCIDDHREGGPFDDCREHRRVDREVRDAGMLDLEQQRTEILDHPGEAAGLRGRGKSQLAAWSDDDVITASNQGRAARWPSHQCVAGGQLVIDLERCRLRTRVDHARIASQLRHHPIRLGAWRGQHRIGGQQDQRNKCKGQLEHGSLPIFSRPFAKCRLIARNRSWLSAVNHVL